MLPILAQNSIDPATRAWGVLALLALLVVSLLLMMIVLVAARSIRRSATRNTSGRRTEHHSQGPTDAWSESARRLRVDPESDEDEDDATYG